MFDKKCLVIGIATVLSICSLVNTIHTNCIINKGNDIQTEFIEEKNENKLDKKDANYDFEITKDGIEINNPVYILHSDNTDDVVINLEDETVKEYDGHVVKISKDVEYTITTCKNEEKTQERIEKTYTDNKTNEKLYTSLFNLNKNTSILITVKYDETKDDINNIKNEVENLFNNACLYSGTKKVTINNIELNNENIKNIIYDNNIIDIQDTKDCMIAFMPFNKDVDGSGFDTECEISSDIKIKQGNYTDDDTGYSPYIYNVNNENIEILSTSTDNIKTLFA